MNKDNVSKKNKNKDVQKLIKLIEEYMDNVNEEMEHGCYGTPEGVPYKYDDEEDYYGNHEKIVNRVCDSIMKIRKFIDNYENN